jgi:iron complex transport system substrate-binding protein
LRLYSAKEGFIMLRHSLFPALALGAALLGTMPAFAQDAFPLSVPTRFGDVVVESAPQRVVSLGWADAEIALALGVRPVGVFDWNRNAGKGVGPWAEPLFGDETPLVFSREQDLNFEQVLGLDPDLITNVRSDNDEATYDRLAAIAPTIYSLEGEGFATPWDVQVLQISQALGKSAEGQKLVDNTKAAIAEVAADHPEFAGKTIQVVVKFGDAYGTYLTGDARFDLLTQFGFIGPEVVLEAAAGAPYLGIGVENFELAEADVLILFALGYSLEELKADPILAQVPAVKEGRAIFIDSPSPMYRALATGSPLSIADTIENLVPLLAEAAAKN